MKNNSISMNNCNVKNLLNVMIFSLILVSAMGLTSAKTVVGGNVFDDGIALGGANVTVECNTYSQNNLSRSDGSYSVIFAVSECGNGDEVIATAIKGNLIGTNNATVHNLQVDSLYLAVIPDIHVVPEFGMIIGILTMFSAIGVFFF